MAGIIHLPTTSRARQARALTRRTLMLGAAGYAAASTIRIHASAQGSATPGATPDVSSGDAPTRLIDMLSLVPPDHLSGPDPNNWLFTWLDLQTHLTALGNPDLSSGNVNISTVMSPLVSDDPLFRYGATPETRSTFGFSVGDIHQTLVTGAAPEQAVYYSGGVEISQLPPIWEAAGYMRKSGPSGDFWTIGENGEVDLNSPIGQFGVSRLNNVAILKNSVLVFTSTADRLEQIQELVMNGGASAADDEGLAALIRTMQADAVNVIALPGSALDAQSITPENPGAEVSQTTRDLLAESDDAVGPMPKAQTAFFGITAGAVAPATENPEATPTTPGNADAEFFVDLLMSSSADATAAAKIVAWRIEHMTSPVAGQAYRNLLTPKFTGEDAATGSVAAMTFASPQSIAIWSQLLMIQDLWPFVWLAPERG